MAPQTENVSERQLLKDSQNHLKTAAHRAYSSVKKKTITNQQIIQLLPMVNKIAQRTVTYLKPPLSFEDLVSAGTIGLLKAAHDYDPAHRAVFKTYAYIRIRGAILDEVRGLSLMPSNVDKQISRTTQLSRKIAEQTGSAPTDNELAQKLEISIDQLYRTFENARAKQFVSIDICSENSSPISNSLAAENTTTPHQQLEKAELKQKLAEAIKQLDQRQRQIILLYYQQQLTMKQIAQVFKITEPRVSQLHASALFNLSIKLRQWKDGR